jgi:hypothetical protein
MPSLHKLRFPAREVNTLIPGRGGIAGVVDAPTNGRERVIILGSGWAGENSWMLCAVTDQSHRLRPLQEA